MFWAVFKKKRLIQSNEIDPEVYFLGPENEKAHSPKIARSLGRMYCEVEAERRPVYE